MDIDFDLTLLFLLFAFPLFGILIGIFKKLFEYKEFKNSLYSINTKSNFFDVNNDVGKFGEYVLYRNLQKFDTLNSKFLFNIYIPIDSSRTTEIDLVMINSKGIFVFENKNYNGWIFGNSSNSKWVQSFPVGLGRCKKIYFYNPIMQNDYHVKYLKQLINLDVSIYSIIVFSDDCRLVNIQNTSNAIVTSLSDLKKVIENINSTTETMLEDETVNKIYNTLYKFSQVSDEVKIKHILDLKH